MQKHKKTKKMAERSSLDFEEFPWAMNTPLDVIEDIKKSLVSLEEIRPSYQEYFKERVIRYIASRGCQFFSV